MAGQQTRHHLSARVHSSHDEPQMGVGGRWAKKQAARCNAPRVCAWRCQLPAARSGVAYPPHGRAATGHAAVLAAGTQGAWLWPLPWGDVHGLPPPRRGALVVKGGTVLTALGASEVHDGGGRRRERAWSPFASAVLGRSSERGLVRGGVGGVRCMPLSRPAPRHREPRSVRPPGDVVTDATEAPPLSIRSGGTQSDRKNRLTHAGTLSVCARRQQQRRSKIPAI